MGDMATPTFLNFFKNHGLLSIGGKPPWRTVKGGSHKYVAALLNHAPIEQRFGLSIKMIRRTLGRVVLIDDQGGQHAVDEVVLATHSDQALDILGAEASNQQRAVLSAITYAPNQAYLHTDMALMPQRKLAWASWNYLRDQKAQSPEDSPVSLTYWMNNLQPLRTKHNVFLTLNPMSPPAAEHILAQWQVLHPQFNAASTQAQGQLAHIQGLDHIWFVGAWAGYGFHEDGCQAGVSVGAALGGAVPWGQLRPISSAAACVHRDALARRDAIGPTPLSYALAAE